MSTFTEPHPLYEEFEVEESRVARWRFEQFCSLGFGNEESLLLTVSDADLHQARTLVATGCSLFLALKILV